MFRLYTPVKLVSGMDKDSLARAVEWMKKQYDFYPRFQAGYESLLAVLKAKDLQKEKVKPKK